MSLPADLLQLVRLSVAGCRGDWGALREVRAQAGPEGPDRRWREALLQLHLFAGIPRTVEACAVLQAAGGLGVPAEEEHEPADGRDDARGQALFQALYGDAAAAVQESLRTAHPGLARVVLEHAYAGVLSRPGLEPAAREVLAVACLAASDLERQLASHARGAARLGVPLDWILDAVAEGSAALETDRRQALTEVARRYGTVARGGGTVARGGSTVAQGESKTSGKGELDGPESP
jgi:alkylhydroperoxidase/carboxymuconolactone decarboxylase family protein YurZ